MDLEILYRDERLVAVNKPAGLLVHRSGIDRHERRFALQQLRDQIGRRVYPLHRLDKPTSGVLLFALSPAAAERMGERFAAGAVEKIYLAVVRGYTEAEGIIDHPLRERLDPATDRRARRDKDPQPAVTAYRRLATVELPLPLAPFSTSRYSLVEARPRTGRKHQLRRHFKHIAHPLIGDSTYGKGPINRLFAERFDCPRLLLHARRLAFVDPWSGAETVIEAPPDAAFVRAVRLFGKGFADSA